MRGWISALVAGLVSFPVVADLSLHGVFGNDRVVVGVNGAPRVVRIGETVSGFKLVKVADDHAEFQGSGRRMRLHLVSGALSGQTSAATEVRDVEFRLGEDSLYTGMARVNGRDVKAVIDTGAEKSWIPAPLATRLGLDTGNPLARTTIQTSGGIQQAYLVKAKSIQVGSHAKSDIDVFVGEGDEDFVLLGMNFLSGFRLAQMPDRIRISGAGNQVRAKDEGMVIKASPGGVFESTAVINGVAVPAVMDTAATLVSLDSLTARKIGIDYLTGEPVMAAVPGGHVRSWRVRIDSVKVGNSMLRHVPGIVHENQKDGPCLIGVSFLGKFAIDYQDGSMRIRNTSH